jgi:uncharacterized protein YaaR (DUF327 family)
VDKIDSPSGGVPLFNPAAYTHAEAQRTKDKRAIKTGAGPSRVSFSRLLEETGTLEVEDLSGLSPSEEALQVLLDDVHSAGDALKQKPLGEQIRGYKRAVRRFLHYVVENGFTLESHAGVPNYLKPGFKGQRGSTEAREGKLFYNIQVVDEKLEQLAAGVLAGHIDQLELLSRLDEITGLLVDLVS